MAIQEMNLTLKHRSGRSNASADALSRNPVSEKEAVEVCTINSPPGETDASLLLELSSATKQKLSNLTELQKSDSTFKDMFLYLADGVLPDEDKTARKVILEIVISTCWMKVYITRTPTHLEDGV